MSKSFLIKESESKDILTIKLLLLIYIQIGVGKRGG
jgi:hypothetical protein